MSILFSHHNRHLDNPEKFNELDPNLSYLSTQPYSYLFPLISNMPREEPGIYTLVGGRQIGKTTLLKQWMQSLLDKGVDSKAIRFLTGDLIDDHHSLVNTFQQLYEDLPDNKLLYIVLDEVTYIKDWDKGIKYLADIGLFSKTILILTGSDLKFLKEARMRFPGRRGNAEQIDYHLYPLSFQEVVALKASGNSDEDLYQIFSEYLLHGGYLTAINDFARHRSIRKGTLQTYSDWIRGDMLKQGKSETYLKEILSALLKTYGSQITWNSLSQHTSIQHPSTVQEYCGILQSMEAIFIQSALIEDKLAAAPKKAKKIVFCDPFIYHCLNFWIINKVPSVEKEIEPFLVETVLVNYVRRFFNTYYIKAEGEVDIAYVKDNKFWPVEIKWTNQIRPKDISQILKYKNHLIVTKNKEIKSDKIKTQWIFDFLGKFDQ